MPDYLRLAFGTFVVLAPGAHWSDPMKYPYTKLRAGVKLYPLGPKYAGSKAR